MAIYSCKGCVAPKRYPGCHGYCPEYLEEKAKHDALKAEYDKQQALGGAIYSQRISHIHKALKNRVRKG